MQLEGELKSSLRIRRKKFTNPTGFNKSSVKNLLDLFLPKKTFADLGCFKKSIDPDNEGSMDL